MRRHSEMLLDQAWVLAKKRLVPVPPSPPFDGQPRFALVTVNFSTTRYLKLMLLTLAEQEDLDLIARLIIVDNDSHDGGLPFLRRLSEAVPQLHLIEQSWFPSHARGLRRAIDELQGIEESVPTPLQSNILLACDTDIIFRNPQTLSALAGAFTEQDCAFAGELRHGLYPYPEAQASFFAVRRDILARSDVAPIVHHGAPAYFLQRSLWRAKLHIEDFPSNFGGYILHRGRSGVAAARTYRPHDAHATARNYSPHYMGVSGGEHIWQATERKFEEWLSPEKEPELLQLLKEKLGSLGSQPREPEATLARPQR